MADGKHCPVCGEDVGYWPVALSLFWVRCPHCRTCLHYLHSPTMQLANVFGALSLVFASLLLGVLAGVEVVERGGGLLAVLGIGTGVMIGLAISLGFVLQLLLAPALRRTQRLATLKRADELPEDFS